VSLDLVPQAIEVLERAMRGRPGYGSLDIVKKELERLRSDNERLRRMRRSDLNAWKHDPNGPVC
jgi:hypothetical protein